MNDDCPNRAEARRNLVLVGPPPVVQAPFARKQFRVPFRVVIEHDQDFAAYVVGLVIVPVVFRRLYAITHENQLRACQRCPGCLIAHIGDKPRRWRNGNTRRKRPRLGQLRSHTHQLKGLLVAPGCARCDIRLGKLRRDPLPRPDIPRAAGPAAFVFIACQFRHHRPKLLLPDPLRNPVRIHQRLTRRYRPARPRNIHFRFRTTNTNHTKNRHTQPAHGTPPVTRPEHIAPIPNSPKPPGSVVPRRT